MYILLSIVCRWGRVTLPPLTSFLPLEFILILPCFLPRSKGPILNIVRIVYLFFTSISLFSSRLPLLFFSLFLFSHFFSPLYPFFPFSFSPSKVLSQIRPRFFYFWKKFNHPPPPNHWSDVGESEPNYVPQWVGEGCNKDFTINLSSIASAPNCGALSDDSDPLKHKKNQTFEYLLYFWWKKIKKKRWHFFQY